MLLSTITKHDARGASTAALVAAAAKPRSCSAAPSLRRAARATRASAGRYKDEALTPASASTGTDSSSSSSVMWLRPDSSWFERPAPSVENSYHAEHVLLLDRSFQRCTGQSLLEFFGAQSSTSVEGSGDGVAGAKAQALYEAAPFVLLSHSTPLVPPPPLPAEPREPLMDYCNLTAQRLFKYEWEELVGMPSRLTAESPKEQAERELFMSQVRRQGFVQDYCGECKGAAPHPPTTCLCSWGAEEMPGLSGDRFGLVGVGVRVAKDGQRFAIRDAIIWNLYEEDGAG